jgi:ABC-2 type transport system permease protein
MLNSLRDEVNFLFSGMGMPYQKVALMVAVVCAVFFTFTLGNNTVQEAPVAVIDLDNSKYSHELTETINASPFMQVKAVFYTPMDAKTLFYNDKYLAAIVLPKDLEKNRYSNAPAAWASSTTILTAALTPATCGNI